MKMVCIYCQEPLRKARNASDTANLYLDAKGFANCYKFPTGPHMPGTPVTEVHPHVTERRRLQALLKEASDRSHSGRPVTNQPEVGEARLRLYVLNRIIDTATEIQAMEPALCYMTACDLIEEILLSGGKKGE
jgi:hypothetical protein